MLAPSPEGLSFSERNDALDASASSILSISRNSFGATTSQRTSSSWKSGLAQFFRGDDESAYEQFVEVGVGSILSG